MNVIPTVGVLVFKNKKVLLVRHGEGAHHEVGTYGWPGGRIDNGESLRRAAVRELEEETGLKVKEEDLEELQHGLAPVAIKRKNGEVLHFSVHLYRCKKFTGNLRATEETTPEWVSVSNLANYSLLPNVQKAALQYII
jgi:8-oxo-dGTP diphosphatase